MHARTHQLDGGGDISWMEGAGDVGVGVAFRVSVLLHLWLICWCTAVYGFFHLVCLILRDRHVAQGGGGAADAAAPWPRESRAHGCRHDVVCGRCVCVVGVCVCVCVVSQAG
ncbi:hypothetical protein PLESTM_001012600 [Pleodorina starrii]|nr:hypothetical protein PLESTM_001012600 [Pleodorina starrii]